MILKQKYTNYSEKNTDIGNAYLLIEKNLNRNGFHECGEDFYGANGWKAVQERDDIAAFIVHNEGEDKKIEPLFANNYNAIMANNGDRYHVITCMPFDSEASTMFDIDELNELVTEFNNGDTKFKTLVERVWNKAYAAGRKGE